MTMIKIVTHDSRFHADDVFGTATLLLLLGREKCEVVRSRNEETIDSGDYVLDVGNVYDPDKNRFDHHQEGGAGVRDNGIPYASFGLIWKHFGTELCGSKTVANVVEETLVQPIDARDNGIEVCTPVFETVRPYAVGRAFSAFLPTWKEKETKHVDDAFMEVVGFAMNILEREIKSQKDLEEGKRFVEKAYEVAGDKRVIIMSEEPVLDREVVAAVLSRHPEPLYSVKYRPSQDAWQVACVRDDMYAYKNRKSLPKAWAGKRDEELAKVTGVADALFCHNGLFMCLARSKEGALQLAKLALAA